MRSRRWRPSTLGVAIVLPMFAALGAALFLMFGDSAVASLGLAAGWLVLTGLLELGVMRIRRPVALRGTIAFAVFVVTSFFVAYVGVADSGLEEPTPRTIKSAMRVTRAHLRIVASDLNRLPDFGAAHHRAVFSNCSVDSGDLMEPAETRAWNVPRATTSQIAQALVDQGWSGTNTPDNFGGFEFTRQYPDFVAHAFVDPPFESSPAFVEVRELGPAPCYLPD